MKQIVGLPVAWLISTIMLAMAIIGPPALDFGESPAPASRSHSYERSYHSQRKDFYTLLRWVCCAAFAYSAVAAFQMKRRAWTWVFGILAVLFNPLARFHLKHGTWLIIYWASIAIILIAASISWRDRGTAAKAENKAP